MHINRICFTIISSVFLLVIPVQAQSVWVVSKMGNFYKIIENRPAVVKGKKAAPQAMKSPASEKVVRLRASQELNLKDVLRVPGQGKLVLFDIENKREYEFRSNYEGVLSVAKIISSTENTSARRLTEIYFKYLCMQMMKKKSNLQSENALTAVLRHMDITSDEEDMEEPSDDNKYLEEDEATDEGKEG